MINRITQLFGIRYPIIQAGMVWCSGWKLVSAVSNAGGLGVMGSGSMYPDIFRDQVRKCKAATSMPFGVNLPLLYPDIDKHIQIILDEGVKIVFTSAGNPVTWTPELKQRGITVVHVVGSSKFAQKSEAAGVDAVVAEGFEAGGHNGVEETTTMCLIPMVKDSVSIPVIAAGGIATGKGMLAAFILGAEGVQIGTRFVASEESSAHPNFKEKIVNAAEGDTVFAMKKLIPARMLRNKLYEQMQEAEFRGASKDELKQILGRAKTKQGMFEGDMEYGEIGIGEVSSIIHDIKPAALIVSEIWNEFQSEKARLSDL